jgi:SAM-dependent methyltransferase
MNNPWDALAPQFPQDETELTAWYDADNPLLAEPTILEYLAQHLPNPAGKRLLDFGCGSGQFAHKLQRLGYKVDGIDPAPKMITAAQARYGADIALAVGAEQNLLTQPTYDAVVSVMVLQFVLDAEAALRRLAAATKPGGHVVLAVHNPDFISDWIKAGHPHYVDFDDADHPTHGTLMFGPEIAVPIYLQTAETYNALAARCGLTAQLEAYPPFTSDFLQRFPVDGPTEHSEYLILGYQKNELQ